ncbi:hypothetical protein FQN54_004581 [Arachnomyces sp. PD_36]|nr:hypothetical protein FQN54_004581 [Arachnomyces sp. PD_36]
MEQRTHLAGYEQAEDSNTGRMTSTSNHGLENPIPTRDTNSGMSLLDQNGGGWRFSSLSEDSSSSSGQNNDSGLHGSSSSLQSLPALATRKRQRESNSPGLLRGDLPDPKSRKATPNHLLPEITASSSSSRPVSRLSDGDGLEALLGLSDNDNFSDIQREQLEAERQLEERREQERRDAEFARFLEEGDQPRTESVSPAPRASGFSSFASLPPLPNIASFSRAGPSRQAGPSTASSGYAGLSFSQFRTPEKAEVSKRTQQGYVDISSDSEPEEIPSRAFPAQNRAPGPPPGLSSATPTYNRYTTSVVDGRSWPSTSSSYVDLRHDSQILGSTGPHGLGPNPNPPGAYPISPYERLAHDRARSWRDEALMMGSPSSWKEAHQAHLSAMGLGRYGTSMGQDSMYNHHRSLIDPDDAKDELKKLLQNIRPDEDLGDREGTPEAMKYPLMEHQKVGLAWMKSMEEGSNKGGILADDMGLGKTIQALALMVTRPSDTPERKTTLIVAPVALIQQWKREIERMLRPDRHQLSVYIFHGQGVSKTKFNTLKTYDVVLTTFGTIASEYKRKLAWGNKPLDHPASPAFPLLGPNSKFHRVIIDEAQCIKNKGTKSALACSSLDSFYRWCMTGTPMMNNIDELYSLINFLKIPPYNQYHRFTSTFSRPLKSEIRADYDSAMQKLQALLKAILLRRTKTSKIDGKPILQLPPRTTEQIHTVFSEDEQEFYNALETQTQLQFNRYLAAGTVGRNYSNVLVLLLRLRQACCHPHLITDFGIETSAVDTDELDLVANARQFDNEVVIRLKSNEASECPVCIDAVENAIIFFPCGHSTCAECFARISDPAQALAQGHEGARALEIKCPNCRGKVDPKKITDNVSFKSVHFPDENAKAIEAPVSNEAEAEEESDDSDDSDESDDENDDGSDLRDFIVPDGTEETQQRPRRKKKKDRKGKGKAGGRELRSLADLKKDAMKNAKAKRKYLKKLAKRWQTSAKIEKTLEILQGIEHDQKTIIFSQFTSLLDLLEVPISRNGWGYQRYDGSMKPAERNQAVLDFTDKPDCKILLVSLKAGNSGLNLVAASHVIIFDPFWNPYVEEQAIDRAHRIGQLRPVRVHRVLIKNTVEDRILTLQEKKRDLIEGALDEKASKNVGRLNTRELGFLFGVHS